jgi:hypothetical protein
MEICHGIVKGNVVMLPEGANLPEGPEVEVRAVSTEQLAAGEAERLVIENPNKHL